MNEINKSENQESIPKTPLAFFIYAIKPHGKWAFFAALVMVIASGVSAGSSYLFKLIIEAVEAGDLHAALFWGLLFPVILFFIQSMYRVSGYATANLATRINKTTSDDLHVYLLSHSHSYFINRFAGSISNKIRNVIGALEEIVPDIIFGHLNVFVGFLVTFSLIFTVDLYSALLFLGLIVVLFYINKYLAPEKQRLAKINAEIGTALQGRAVDLLSNISVVRQYSRREYELVELKKLTTKRYLASLENWIYTEKLLFINTLVLFLFSFGMFWSLVSKWGDGAISTGDFVMVIALVSGISRSLLFIGRAFNAMARTVGELREGLEDLLIDYDIVDKDNSEELKIKNSSISWQNVNFKFDENQVFSSFNLEIPAGQRVGLVGSSGAGKTTFVSLLLRQHELDNGEILIDGRNIATVTQDSLREAIAVVPQEPSLFHRTIRENIAYGNIDATFENIVEVSKKANAHEFIEKLPNGYDTMVGERGIKLSGGQKQRVAIARAML